MAPRYVPCNSESVTRDVFTYTQDSCFLLLLACCSAVCVLPQGVFSHTRDLALDASIDENPVLYEAVHEKRYRFGDIVNKEHLELTFEGMVITSVRATDRWKDGTGGSAYLEAGGVGQSMVKLKLKGQPLRGYSFDVVIRGKPIQDARPLDIDIRTQHN